MWLTDSEFLGSMVIIRKWNFRVRKLSVSRARPQPFGYGAAVSAAVPELSGATESGLEAWNLLQPFTEFASLVPRLVTLCRESRRLTYHLRVTKG